MSGDCVKKYTDEQIDAFLDGLGIELFPYQREMFRLMINSDKPLYYIPARKNYELNFMSALMYKFYMESEKGE